MRDNNDVELGETVAIHRANIRVKANVAFIFPFMLTSFLSRRKPAWRLLSFLAVLLRTFNFFANMLLLGISDEEQRQHAHSFSP